MINFSVRGVIVPILTPFDDRGELDAGALQQLVDYLIARGVAGLFPGGTTGEGFLLSLDERRRLAENAVSAADGRVPVIVHTGATTTADALTLTVHAQQAGADAVAVIPPFVYRHSDEGLLAHYVAVAEAVPDLPILLYNFPAICNNVLSFDLVIALLERASNIVGMKDSSGSLETLVRLHAATDGAFLAFNGSDGQVLMSAAMGLDGCVSGNANVVPELLVALHSAATAGDLAEARVLQQQVNTVRRLLGDGGNLSLFKQMIARRGIHVGDVRAPLVKASPELADERWQQLASMEIGM